MTIEEIKKNLGSSIQTRDTLTVHVRFLLDTIAQRDKEIEDALATALKWERYAIVCQTECDTAHAALRKYGEHTENYEVHSWDLRKAPCTCGFITTLEVPK